MKQVYKSVVVMALLITVTTQIEAADNSEGEFLLNKVVQENPELNDAEILIKTFDAAGEVRTTFADVPVSRDNVSHQFVRYELMGQGLGGPSEEYSSQQLTMASDVLYDESGNRNLADTLGRVSVESSYFVFNQTSKYNGPLLGTKYSYSNIKTYPPKKKDDLKWFGWGTNHPFSQGEKGLVLRDLLEIRRVGPTSYVQVRFSTTANGSCTRFAVLDRPETIKQRTRMPINPYKTADGKVVCEITHIFK